MSASPVRMPVFVAVVAALVLAPAPFGAAPETKLKAETFTGLAFRSIGPAVTSGRVSDIAVHPRDRGTWYVAVASGGVWKTVNGGTTWAPLFDAQGSFSIGCVAIDPRNPLTVWVGTGENNSQRSVAYGDGIYKSTDGGASWENVGLKNSEHIGKVVIDPRNTDVVYVASQGPLWADGGDRGLYKTVDGGKSWKAVLSVSPMTGVTDVLIDPRNPDVLYAASYQRRRHVWTLVNGGPESAIYKSTDAGATWKKLENGLPKEEMGRIGLALSDVNPDVVYATIEAAGKAGGFFRSTNGGGTFERRSDYVSGSAQYYQEIFCDPKNVDRVYVMDTWMMVTDDGGKTFRKVGERYKHVDNHALWIDPANTDYLLAGCDGGVYESWDRGATWEFKANLPVTQFYKVTADDASPFYNVYGGTQDNQTLGGPSRTPNEHGITNADWFVTVGGDGFQSQVDPLDSSIVYSQWQYGELIRFDRKTGEQISIQPQPGKGEEPLRWNWDSPLLISPHSHTRLYFAANRLFRSDDRGNSWVSLGPDLTRRVDRNKLKVMGRVWSIDAVAKNASTSFYGNIVALAESTLLEGLLYVGTDDGLIQVSENGGENWRRQERFPGVPEMTYVSRLTASQHSRDRVYAAFDNHKMGDFKPYVLKSEDRGRTWTSVAGDLPERGTVYALAEDPRKPELLFAGTEFGVFFTPDGGNRWIQLKGGIPVIQVRDLVIQKRESDLVVGSFGRGIYILDNYAPLRRITSETLDHEAELYPVKDAWMYIPSTPLGLKDKSSLGDAFYNAPNPPFGAVFTYYLREEVKTLKKSRQETEKAVAKKGEDVTYPSWETLRAEEHEEAPAILLVVCDEEGNVVRRLTGPVTAGFQRVTWDLRYPPSSPTQLKPEEPGPFDTPDAGPLVAPGRYTVQMAKRVGGKVTLVGDPQSFEAVPLGMATLPSPDREALLAFQRKTARLQRAVLGVVESVKEASSRLAHLKKAIDETPGADLRLGDRARSLESSLQELRLSLVGDTVVASKNEPTPPSIVDRVQRVVGGHWWTTQAPTDTQRRDYEIAAGDFRPVLERLRELVEVELRDLERAAEIAGAPWTPTRVPTWQPD